ncbi:tetratricopeptide repeat protein [Kribbella sp. NPDC003557]|uniref:tetratricopeptide repeat protein n=1 Tax=Kribbella sp. NPDC003557 TaxID=3154449 RepID=UPI0033B935E8
MTSVRGILIRGAMQAVAVLAVLAGAITWLAGWRYGHGLVTLGLLLYVATFFTRQMSFSRSWGVLAMRQAEQASGDEALEHVASAVRAFRKLAGRRPAESWRLALALDEQWDLLNAQDKHEQALPVVEEAVETWRGVVIDQPAYRTNLARALNHAGFTLGELDREDEAIPYTEEAIVLNRALMANHEKHLAQNLANLVVSLHDRDHWERSLPVAEEALATYRRLLPDNPDLLVRAARTAEALVTTQARLTLVPDAIRTAEEQIGYERTLAAADPDHTAVLAEAVRLLGSLAMTADRIDDGKRWWLESMELWRQLAQDRAKHRSEYAAAANIIGHGFSCVAEPDQSLAITHEGLAVRRALAAGDPRQADKLLGELGHATVTAWHYLDDSATAAEFAAEAVTVARQHPDSAALLDTADYLRRAEFVSEAETIEALAQRP